MSLNLLNTDPKQFLDALKTAYYEQTGETLQIGSDYFAVASVYAYCLSVFFGAVNNATQNRYIDTATGEFLDAIAANYGINNRPTGYHSTCMCEVKLKVTTILPQTIHVRDDSGNVFTNRYKITGTVNSTVQAVFEAVESGSKYNGIPANSLVNLDTYTLTRIYTCTNTEMSAGGTDGFPYTVDGDNAYREWLKTEIQSFKGAGTYAAYEARAKNADPRVTDVYVLKQDDTGYEKGKVIISFLCTQDTATVKQIIKESCSDESFRPIGDLVVVNDATPYTLLINGTIRVTYPLKFSDLAADRNVRIFNEYKQMLLSKINKPFVVEELCDMLTTIDDDGVYALDAKPRPDLAGQNTPFYPGIGRVLNPIYLEFSNYFINRG